MSSELNIDFARLIKIGVEADPERASPSLVKASDPKGVTSIRIPEERSSLNQIATRQFELDARG